MLIRLAHPLAAALLVAASFAIAHPDAKACADAARDVSAQSR